MERAILLDDHPDDSCPERLLIRVEDADDAPLSLVRSRESQILCERDPFSDGVELQRFSECLRNLTERS